MKKKLCFITNVSLYRVVNSRIFHGVLFETILQHLCFDHCSIGIFLIKYALNFIHYEKGFYRFNDSKQSQNRVRHLWMKQENDYCNISWMNREWDWIFQLAMNWDKDDGLMFDSNIFGRCIFWNLFFIWIIFINQPFQMHAKNTNAQHFGKHGTSTILKHGEFPNIQHKKWRCSRFFVVFSVH